MDSIILFQLVFIFIYIIFIKILLILTKYANFKQTVSIALFAINWLDDGDFFMGCYDFDSLGFCIKCGSEGVMFAA